MTPPPRTRVILQAAEACAETETALARAEEHAIEVMRKAESEMARATLEARVGTVPEAALAQAIQQAQAQVCGCGCGVCVCDCVCVCVYSGSPRGHRA
jgi:hypothetical protein